VRPHQPDAEVIGHLFLRAREQPLKNVRQGKNRRPEIKAKPVLPQDIQLATDLFIFVVHLHCISLLGKRNGCGKAAEPGANDNDLFLFSFDVIGNHDLPTILHRWKISMRTQI